MPTLPLYDTTAHPDGWHHVTAPGGYEWWHIDAEDAALNIRLTTDLCEGDQLSRAYQQAYRRYRRRPTRVAPPVPRDYLNLRINVMEKGRPLWCLDARQPPGALRASSTRLEVGLGPCTLRGDDDGVLRVSLEPLPVSVNGTSVSADLTFRPIDLQPPEVREKSRNGRSTVHFVVVASSRYEVSGTLREWSRGETQRALEFRGQGQYRHSFGTGPIAKAELY